MADHKIVGEGHVPYDIERSNRNVVTVLPLRDWFAGMAMQSIFGGAGARDVADRDQRYDETNLAEVVAANAYEMADAMLKARAGK